MKWTKIRPTGKSAPNECLVSVDARGCVAITVGRGLLGELQWTDGDRIGVEISGDAGALRLSKSVQGWLLKKSSRAVTAAPRIRLRGRCFRVPGDASGQRRPQIAVPATVLRGRVLMVVLPWTDAGQ